MAMFEVRSSGSTRNSPKFQPFPSLGVGKGQDSTPTPPKTFVLPTISPSPPTSANQMHRRPWPALYKSALADNNPFVTYSTPKSGASVDLWKKVAKKAELELHLERNNHRSDSSKDHHIIHRLNRRMIPMEKALGKSKATVKQQEKLIQDLKSKLYSTSEKTEGELSYLRLQNQKMQRYLAALAENNTLKITELEEELRQANSSAERLKEQMDQIYDIVNDLPDANNNTGESETCASHPADRGLVVLANVKVICHNNEQLKQQLRDTDKKVAAVAQENERLRKAVDEAACRRNQIQLKETEDMLESRKDLENFARSCTSSPDCEPTKSSLPQNPTTLPLHEPVPSQKLECRSMVKQTERCKYENSEHLPPREDKDSVLLCPAEAEDATDLSAMRAVPAKTIVYAKPVKGEEVQTIGVALVDELHATFRVLSSKLESAKQTTAILRKENEELRSTMCEGMKCKAISNFITPDDCTAPRLVAVRELEKSTEGLRKENAFLEALNLQLGKKIIKLECQTQNLTLDKKTLLETIEVIQSVMRASNGGQEPVSPFQEFSKRAKVQGAILTEFQEMVQKLIQENNGARTSCESSNEDKELKEELSRLRKLYAQSLDVSKQLQAERDFSDLQQLDLKEACRLFLQENQIYIQSQPQCKLLQKEKILQELQKDYQNFKPGSTTSVVQDEFSNVLEMARGLVEELHEARSAGEILKQQMELKEKELFELRPLYHESKSLCVQLQGDVDALEFEMQELHKSVQCMKKFLDKGMDTSDSEEVARRNVFWKTDALAHEKVLDEVSLVVQKLKTAERSFYQIEDALGIKGLPESDLDSKAASILIILNSQKEDRDLASIALRSLKELLPRVKQHLKYMVDIFAESESNSSPVAGENDRYSRSPSRDEGVNFKEVMKLVNDFTKVVKVLPSLNQKVRRLKAENDTLPCNLQALELENLAITCRIKEDQEKLHRVRISSQREINNLKQQLFAVESLIASISSNSTESLETSFNNCSEGSRGGQTEENPLLKGLVAVRDELSILRREKYGAGVKADKLALQLRSEQEKAEGLERILSITEARTHTLQNRAVAAEAAARNLTSQVAALQKDLTNSKAEFDVLEKKLCAQEELLTTEKSKCATLLDDQRTEIMRLGGSDVVDHREKMRRADAAEMVKQILWKNPKISGLPQSKDGYSRKSPLTCLTTFTVDLLVNCKIFTQLEVGGYTGGLCHGVIHYFSVSAQTGNITFADSIMPGSQSSNMVADVSLVPKEDQKLYEIKPGDVLGLKIKVSSLEDSTPREALYNTCILRTDQVLDAIKGQTVQSFTLWPDLVSCWRWERGKTHENRFHLGWATDMMQLESDRCSVALSPEEHLSTLERIP